MERRAQQPHHHTVIVVLPHRATLTEELLLIINSTHVSLNQSVLPCNAFYIFAYSLLIFLADMNSHHSSEKLGSSSSSTKAAVYSIDYHHLQTAYPSLDLSQIDTVTLPAHQTTTLYPYELTTTASSVNGVNSEEDNEAAIKTYNDNIQLLLSHQQVSDIFIFISCLHAFYALKTFQTVFSFVAN